MNLYEIRNLRLDALAGDDFVRVPAALLADLEDACVEARAADSGELIARIVSLKEDVAEAKLDVKAAEAGEGQADRRADRLEEDNERLEKRVVALVKQVEALQQESTLALESSKRIA